MADPEERRAMALGACAALFAIVVGSVGSCESLARSTRIEVGASQGSFDLEKGADPDTDSQWAAVSFDLFCWLNDAHERERDERLAAMIRAAPPPDFHVPSPDGGLGSDSSPAPESGENPSSGEDLPWYVTPSGITGLSMLLATLVGVWQRERLSRGVDHVRKRLRRPPRTPTGA